MIYFDNAATSPIRLEVAEEMYRILKDEYGNPSSTHALGRKTKTIIEEARKSIAQLLGAKPGEILFTSGGTEADNWALRKAASSGKIKAIISSPIEHHAVTHTIEELEAQGIIKAYWVQHHSNGHVDLDHLETLLKDHPQALVSLMHANNEIGNLIDLKTVGDLCEKYQALFHSDTVQTIGHFPIRFSDYHIHFASAAAHKFNGPKGVGFMYMREGHLLSNFITGGSQERGSRGGTENVYGIAGMAKALQLAYAHLENDQMHIKQLKSALIQKLRDAIPGISFNGDAEGHSNYSVLNVGFPMHPVSEMLLFKLDIEGVCCSGGSACNSGSNVGSHVLRYLNIPQDRANVRFSIGHQNTLEEVDKVVNILKEIYVGAEQTVH